MTSFFKRLCLSVLVLSAGISFTFIDITKLWMYFGWANQCLSTISLWAVSVFLKKKKRFYFISLIPAIFMSMVCFTYIFYEKIGFNLPLYYAKLAALIIVCILIIVFYKKTKVIFK